MNKTVSESAVYEHLYQEATIIFLVLDQDGYVLDANRYTKDIVGPDLLTSKKHLYDVLVDFGNLPLFSELIQQGKTSRMFNITTVHGLPQTFYFTFYEKGNRIFAFGQLDHIEIETMRKNLIEANQEINNLARKLQKSNAQLTQVNALKNQFLGMAAHDLRNPIGIVLQYSKFLLDETKSLLNENQNKLLRRIMDSSKFMLQLLNDLLDISRIESGKLELSLRLTDFVSFVERNVSFNQILAAKKQMKLIFRGEENLPSLMIDQAKIEQVLNNLISNAIKYSFSNTIIQVCVSQSGDSIMISVQDEGQGIPENEISKLFQAFQTTSVKSTASEKSTGLGLMIAKKIITGHQGKIWVDSKPGRGSTFFFTLPIPEEELRKRKNAPLISPMEEIEQKQSGLKQNKETIEQIRNPDLPLSSYLNQSVIDKYRRIDPDFLTELIEIFLEQTPSLIDELHKAIENEEWEKMPHIIDQLRGASANLGTWQLERLCHEMMELKAGQDVLKIDNFLNQLDNLYESTKQALQQLIV